MKYGLVIYSNLMDDKRLHPHNNCMSYRVKMEDYEKSKQLTLSMTVASFAYDKLRHYDINIFQDLPNSRLLNKIIQNIDPIAIIIRS